jgi:hypothetical protein
VSDRAAAENELSMEETVDQPISASKVELFVTSLSHRTYKIASCLNGK